MDKTEKLQMIDEGKMLEDAVEEFVKNELAPEEREKYYCKWLPQIAVSKRFGDEPNKSKVVACRCIERLRTEKQAAVLPKELDNDKAKALFDKAERSEFISKNGSLYKWNKSKENTYQLLAYFCEKMSQFLNLGKTDANGNPTTSWKPFERLFGIDNIKGYKNDWLRINLTFNPVGYEKIDALFV